jgi:hypothetical protein
MDQHDREASRVQGQSRFQIALNRTQNLAALDHAVIQPSWNPIEKLISRLEGGSDLCVFNVARAARAEGWNQQPAIQINHRAARQPRMP